MYVCFDDLQEAYDLVDREQLWKVLAQAGVPDKRITAIHDSSGGMLARVRMDDWSSRTGLKLPRDCDKDAFTGVITPAVSHVLCSGARGCAGAMQQS